MKVEDLDIIKNHFEEYSKGTYHSPIYFGNDSCIKYYHKKEDDFHIAIFENCEVYQLNSDHEIQGVELIDLEQFKIRFKSFTGENF